VTLFDLCAGAVGDASTQVAAVLGGDILLNFSVAFALPRVPAQPATPATMTIYSNLPASDSDLAANGYAVMRFSLRGSTAAATASGNGLPGLPSSRVGPAGVRQPSCILSRRAGAKLQDWRGRAAKPPEPIFFWRLVRDMVPWVLSAERLAAPEWPGAGAARSRGAGTLLAPHHGSDSCALGDRVALGSGGRRLGRCVARGLRRAGARSPHRMDAGQPEQRRLLSALRRQRGCGLAGCRLSRDRIGPACGHLSAIPATSSATSTRISPRALRSME